MVKADPLESWGLWPGDDSKLDSHRVELIALGLAVIAVPYAVGMLLGGVVSALEDPRTRIARPLRYFGFFDPPTSWDRAWLRYRQRHGAGTVVVRTKGGLIIRGAFDSGAQVDVAPNPPSIYLSSGYGVHFGRDGEAVALEAEGSEGIFIDGSEILAVYFERPSAPDAESSIVGDAPVSGEQAQVQEAQ
jgi:hypothetical protein